MNEIEFFSGLIKLKLNLGKNKPMEWNAFLILYSIRESLIKLISILFALLFKLIFYQFSMNCNLSSTKFLFNNDRKLQKAADKFVHSDIL